jgi:hypothetical protein
LASAHSPHPSSLYNPYGDNYVQRDIVDPRIVPDYDFHLTHLGDGDPVRIYSQTGDIADVYGLVPLQFSKAARIRAGRDIVDLPVTAQNLDARDITSVIAGRDIYGGAMSVNVGGPGTIYVEAGRNIGPLQSAGGIIGTGKANNRFLPDDGADIFVVAGVANGWNTQAMISRYLDLSSTAEVPYRYSAELATYLNVLRKRHREGELSFTPTDAVAAFRALPENEQIAFLYDILFAELQAAADPVKNPANYGKYNRSYAAIQTLFPPRLGYPDILGNATKANSGSIDLRSATIQTQFGGNISIVAPAGRIVVGSQSATPLSNDPSRTGILTLRGGDIRIFADRDVLVNQSRIFTEQGGDIVMWSSNGDLNAGKGKKTSAFYPPLLRVTGIDGYSRIDPAGLVTGAGVGALQTVQDQPASDVYLIAPHGTVDAGDAGIRATGNVNVAALHVLNADNIKVGGTVSGVPTVPTNDTGGLTQASNTAAANKPTAAPPPAANERPSIIIVEVLGYGGDDDEQPRRRDDKQRGSSNAPVYDPNSAFRVLGNGALTPEQQQRLTDDERTRFRQIVTQGAP